MRKRRNQVRKDYYANLAIKYILLLILLPLLSILAGCSSNVTGKVEEQFTNEPLSDVSIVASMKTNIPEDKKYERCSTATDKNGEFKLTGLSPEYAYTITARKSGYFSFKNSKKNIHPAKKGKTKIIETPISLLKIRGIKGKVIDIISKTPIDNVKIEMSPEQRISQTDYPDYINIKTATDNTGSFSIPGLLPGYSYNIKLLKEGFTTKNYQFRTDGDVDKFNDDYLMLKIPETDGFYFSSQGKYSDRVNQLTDLDWKMEIAWYKNSPTGKAGNQCFYIEKNKLKTEFTRIPRSKENYLVVRQPESYASYDIRIYRIDQVEKLPVYFEREDPETYRGEWVAKKYFDKENLYVHHGYFVTDKTNFKSYDVFYYNKDKIRLLNTYELRPGLYTLKFGKKMETKFSWLFEIVE